MNDFVAMHRDNKKMDEKKSGKVDDERSPDRDGKIRLHMYERYIRTRIYVYDARPLLHKGGYAWSFASPRKLAKAATPPRFTDQESHRARGRLANSLKCPYENQWKNWGSQSYK